MSTAIPYYLRLAELESDLNPVTVSETLGEPLNLSAVQFPPSVYLTRQLGLNRNSKPGCSEPVVTPLLPAETCRVSCCMSHRAPGLCSSALVQLPQGHMQHLHALPVTSHSLGPGWGVDRTQSDTKFSALENKLSTGRLFLLTAPACCRNLVTHLLTKCLLPLQQSCAYEYLWCTLLEARHLGVEWNEQEGQKELLPSRNLPVIHSFIHTCNRY